MRARRTLATLAATPFWFLLAPPPCFAGRIKVSPSSSQLGAYLCLLMPTTPLLALSLAACPQGVPCSAGCSWRVLAQAQRRWRSSISTSKTRSGRLLLSSGRKGGGCAKRLAVMANGHVHTNTRTVKARSLFLVQGSSYRGGPAKLGCWVLIGPYRAHVL